MVESGGWSLPRPVLRDVISAGCQRHLFLTLGLMNSKLKMNVIFEVNRFITNGGGAMDSVIPLTSLKVGEVARIVSINARGELARRIRDMGLGSGMPVSVVGYAPLRDPLALRCAEVTIALRRREAGAIMVQPAAAANN